jgi:hypothetical protein
MIIIYLAVVLAACSIFAAGYWYGYGYASANDETLEKLTRPRSNREKLIESLEKDPR